MKLNLVFESKTVADCVSYLIIEFEGKQYYLDEFYNTFNNNDFQIDSLLPKCTFIYKGKAQSFEEYKTSRIELSNQLDISQKYMNDVFPIEAQLAICNSDYYKAAKFLEKAENCLQTARFYLMQGANIIEYDCKISWKNGYQPIFDIRTINFTTAIIWYNNCFDYVLLVVFLAFELFEKVPRYKKDMTFEEKLKLCTFRAFQNLHKEYTDNIAFNQLWNIMEHCHNAISDLNEWANYAKHKGGIGYIGLKPKSSYQIYTRNPDGTVESRTSEFDPIKLDIDKSIETVVKSHKALFCCLEEIVDFIDFELCKYTIDKDGKFVIPDKSSYVKVKL